MRLEDVTAEIRPRSDWEAVDLGVALVRRDFWRLAGWWLLAMSPVLAAAVLLGRHPFWWLAVVWWCKPVGARLALFDLSRTLFGERMGWREIVRRVAWAWLDRWWVWLGLARFSPRRPLVMPVADLEGLHGVVLRERVRVVRRRGDGAVIGLTAAGWFLQGWLGLVLFGIAAVFVPEGQTEHWSEAFEMWTEGEAMMPPLLLGWSCALSLVPAMAAVDLFVTGAGFGLYLNNRSWIEGWDVELTFKRLAERLRKLGMAVLLVGGWLAAGGGGYGAQAPTGDSQAGREREVLEEVLRDEAFRVRTRTIREREEALNWRLPEWLRKLLPAGVQTVRQMLGTLLLAAALVGLVTGLVWLLRRYRHVLARGPKRVTAGVPTPAGVLAGIGLPAGEMPDDPPATAVRWWREGRRREALALLYRAAILWLVERRQLEIGPATTEDDCMRRVRQAGESRQADHFDRLTAAWVLLAYGGRAVAEQELMALCDTWPYRGEGAEA